MTGWSVDVLGMADPPHDSRDIPCADVGELAKVVGAAAAMSGARLIHIRRIPEPGDASIPAEERLVAVPDDGREAALAQWEARWTALRAALGNAIMPVSSEYLNWMDQIEKRIPTGLPVEQRWVPRMVGRVDLQLEPERITDLFACLLKCAVEWHGEDRRTIATLMIDLMDQAKAQGMTEEAWPESRSAEEGGS